MLIHPSGKLESEAESLSISSILIYFHKNKLKFKDGEEMSNFIRYHALAGTAAI
jgi:hypothetical protein